MAELNGGDVREVVRARYAAAARAARAAGSGGSGGGCCSGVSLTDAGGAEA
jgi:hypothetical protein